MWTSQYTKNKCRTNEAHTRAPAPHPPALRIQMIPRRRAHELSTEHANHIRRIHPIPPFRLHAKDRGAVPDLACLHAHINAERLDDRAGDGVFAGVRANYDTGSADELADYDAQEGLVFLHEETSKQRSPCHADDADEAEAADYQVIVVVRRTRQEEGECRPVGGES